MPDTVAVTAVPLKLPEFWTSDPAMWFARVEAQFRRAQISVQMTKFDAVIEKLPQDVLAAGPGSAG